MIADFLTRVPLFAMLEQDEVARLLDTATWVDVASGEFLFRRGDRGDALFIVETGLMEAVIDEESPTERTLNTFFPNDYFGEMSLLTQEPRSASVRALIDSRLMKISHGELSHVLEDNPTMALHLSRVLSNYLSRTNAHLSTRGARISTLISTGDAQLSEYAVRHLLASLERQFKEPAVIVSLGDTQLDVPSTMQDNAVDLSDILGGVSPLPTGGNHLPLSEKLLRGMDDQTLVAVINSLRAKYGHIMIWTKPSEALKRLAFLTRFDQTFLLVSHPYEASVLEMLSKNLAKVLKGSFRTAIIAPRKTALPTLRLGNIPPIRLPVQSDGYPSPEAIDRLARAIAGLTVGLALGSGTAQGLAHLGVMKALLEAGVPIDLIAGTSGGALYGSMLASGLTIDEAVSRVVYHTRKNLIDKLDFTFPLRGIIRGNQIERMVQSVIGDIAFSDLSIPLYAVATDLDTGDEVVIQEGKVYQGVRASISVPGIFEPYRLNDRILIDGVVVNPLPVSVARAMGADIVIAVQVPAPGKVTMEASAKTSKKKRRNEYNVVSSVVRSHHFVGERLADLSASEADVFIKPEVTGFGWREYRAAPQIIEAGYQAGQGAIQRVSELLWG